uniref:Uncharacterized protein n=1 Tax=Gloeothece verrucosa (strain PCC 7822) TaxID=497965 RepID=E0UAV4_GLOV7|nr:hypothetical protein Cyan7822_3122 [Gloeothece verrucosa PCC 7822]
MRYFRQAALAGLKHTLVTKRAVSLAGQVFYLKGGISGTEPISIKPLTDALWLNLY